MLCPACKAQLGSISSEAQALELIRQHGSSELGFLQFFNLHRTQPMIAGEALDVALVLLQLTSG